VAQPDLGKEHRVVEALEPHGAPALADQRRIRGKRVRGEQHGAPGEILVEKAAAHVVGVVGVAVVGPANRDDRPQRRRPARGDL
jgi:hypothetical protein